MHFNVYFDDVTGQRLTAVAAQAGESRNALIRKAVSKLMNEMNAQDDEANKWCQRQFEL